MSVKYPNYTNLSARINSFTDLFPIKGITALEFAEAGFHSIGVLDYVRCFYCGVGLRGWEDTDDPFKEHAKFSPNCQFLISKKGKYFIEHLQNSNASKRNSKKENNSEKRNQDDHSESSRVLSQEEVALSVQARMDLPIIQQLLRYENNLHINRMSVENALKHQFVINNDDFESLSELIMAAGNYHHKENIT